MSYPRIATLKTAAALRDHLERHGIPLAFDAQLTAPSQTPKAADQAVSQKSRPRERMGEE